MKLTKKITTLFTQDKTTKTSSAIGSISEQYAINYLLQHGLVLVDSNVHCRQGEIDIIMLEGETYVFIEVKYRKSQAFGGAINAVSPAKQQKIKHAITFYLHNAGLNEYNTPCRIDVIALEGNLDKPEVTWLKSAF